MLRRYGFLYVLIVLLAGWSSQNYYSTGEAVSILFAGNSHIRTGNIPGQLQALAALHDIEMTYVDVSINGVNLDGRMRNNAIRQMQNIDFDYVVFQAVGRSLINDMDFFFDDIRSFSQQIRENGAVPVLYSPAWANIDGQPDEEVQAFLTAAHKQAAYENNIILINAGDVWIYAYNAICGLSLYAADGIHANHKGAFLTSSVFMATLFELEMENIPTGNIIDNIPLSKRSPLLQILGFFPHIFRFTQSSNRILFLYTITTFLLTITAYFIYKITQTKNIKKYLLKILICWAAIGLAFMPALQLHCPLYRGENAAALVQSVLNFFELKYMQ